MIEEYITDICKLLNINKPSISYDNSNFTTDTMMAQCDVINNVIYLNNLDKLNPDYFLSIAHELRHIYQYQKYKDFYMSDYKTSDQCSSIEEYNLQIAEIDANAFASIVMTDCFHVQPQWKGMSYKVINAINNRINVLSHELKH